MNGQVVVTKSVTHHSAGGLVYKVNPNQTIEICMIKDSYGHWTLPKGHQEANETLEETAKREISEETGISHNLLELKQKLGEVDYWFTSDYHRDTLSNDGQPVEIHKFVTYFLFQVPTNTQLFGQTGEVEDIKWIKLSELDKINEYQDNKSIIEQAKLFLNNNYGS